MLAGAGYSLSQLNIQDEVDVYTLPNSEGSTAEPFGLKS